MYISSYNNLISDPTQIYSPPIIPRAKRAIIFVIFHKISGDYKCVNKYGRDSIGGTLLIGLICVLEIFLEMSKDLNN